MEEEMGTRTVTFKRTWGGQLINVWIYHPDDVAEKLIFTNNFASSVLDDAAEYLLFWIAAGMAGTELTIEHRIEGPGAEFKPLVKDWKIPPRPGAPLGAILTYQDSRKFKLGGA
jgi:hypothetical protein